MRAVKSSTNGTSIARSARVAICGDARTGCTRPRAAGSTSSSPIVYSIRDAALMLAIATAKNDAATPRSTIQTMLLNPTMVTVVVETPDGAHFTTCTPTYERDERFQKAYATAAKSPDDWTAFEQRFLSGSEQAYQDAVAAFHESGTDGETA